VAAVIDPNAVAQVQTLLPQSPRLISSPALRCRQTAQALWPDRTADTDPRLWEQDFGAHDGLPYADLPDLGILDSAALAAYAPPEGESFADLCARTKPALLAHAAAALDGPVVLVVHAGVIRSVLALVCGSVPAGLAFEIANLSITRLRCGEDGPLSIMAVNQQ
jgi:alpha-ribazole phosphatase